MPTFCRLFICRPDLLPPFLLSLFICPPVSLPPPPSPSLCILQTFLNSFHCFFISSSSTLSHLPVLSFFTSSFFSIFSLPCNSLHPPPYISVILHQQVIYLLPSLSHLSLLFFYPSSICAPLSSSSSEPLLPLLSLSPFPALPWKYWTWSLGEASALLLCQL